MGTGDEAKPSATPRADRGQRKRLQTRAIALLLEGHSVQEAADALGVARTTVHRWQQTREFRAEFRAAQREVLAGTVTLLVRAGRVATAALLKIARNDAANDAARVSAAKALIELGFRGMEVGALADELAELRAMVEAKG